MILKEVLESNFCSRFIKDSIKGTTKNDKMSNKSSQKLLKILGRQKSNEKFFLNILQRCSNSF
jgi:hypothetical protein